MGFWRSRPFDRCIGLHGQRMNFIGLHAISQTGIHQLVALYQTLAFKRSRHNGGIPMAAIALDMTMVTGDSRLNEVLYLISSHGLSSVGSMRCRAIRWRAWGYSSICIGIRMGIANSEIFVSSGLVRVNGATCNPFGASAGNTHSPPEALSPPRKNSTMARHR